MAKINPQTIAGQWKAGIALDVHTLSSTYLGVNEHGHEVYDTTRSEVGELLYRLKYRSDMAAANEIVTTAAGYLKPHTGKFDMIVPVPPSGTRAVQPVIILAKGIVVRRSISIGSDDERDHRSPLRHRTGRERKRAHNHTCSEQPMNTVFIGGSRAVSRLPTPAQERLDNVIRLGAKVIVGDANGTDKAVQKFFASRNYPWVTVYCSGNECRNNVGNWETRHIDPPKGAHGFDFYAAKDRIMAREADYGFMIWDGKSAGTILNILRLVNAGRKAVLVNVPEKTAANFKSANDWVSFLSSCTPGLRKDVRKRATDDEWIELEQPLQLAF